MRPATGVWGLIELQDCATLPAGVLAAVVSRGRLRRPAPLSLVVCGGAVNVRQAVVAVADEAR